MATNTAELRMNPDAGDLDFTLAFLGLLVGTIALVSCVQWLGYIWTPDAESDDD